LILPETTCKGHSDLVFRGWEGSKKKRQTTQKYGGACVPHWKKNFFWHFFEKKQRSFSKPQTMLLSFPKHFRFASVFEI